MPARKMRIELFDGEGNRYTITFEGRISREKAVRLLDLVELLGGAPSGPEKAEVETGLPSKYAKVGILVRRNFPLVWFSSAEVQTLYEREYKEPIGLSTVSTYLARLVTRGALLRAGSFSSVRYRLAQSAAEATAKESTRQS